MSESNYFYPKPLFAQLLNFIPKTIIFNTIEELSCDKYYKRFKTFDHLVTMLYASFHKCESLREVTSGMHVSYKKLLHLGLSNIPRRSTLSDANRYRAPSFFERLYHKLYDYHYNKSDSRKNVFKKNDLFILDSTTMTLFSDVMKGAGTAATNGKKKGGAKAHVLLNAQADLPMFVEVTEARINDKVMLEKVKLPAHSIIVFDKAYRKYSTWQSYTDRQITWVTQAIGDETIVINSNRVLTKDCVESGVIEDQLITLGSGINKNMILTARRVFYKDPETNADLVFLTNNNDLSASQIAHIYKRRWQIELFFKKLKGHAPLKYFLGDNENAIHIQIWCSLITNLLIKIVQDTLTRKWSFANLASIIRHHLMNYVDALKFLNDPDFGLIKKRTKCSTQMTFNFTTNTS